MTQLGIVNVMPVKHPSTIADKAVVGTGKTGFMSIFTRLKGGAINIVVSVGIPSVIG